MLASITFVRLIVKSKASLFIQPSFVSQNFILKEFKWHFAFGLKMKVWMAVCLGSDSKLDDLERGFSVFVEGDFTNVNGGQMDLKLSRTGGIESGRGQTIFIPWSTFIQNYQETQQNWGLMSSVVLLPTCPGLAMAASFDFLKHITLYLAAPCEPRVS